MPASPLAPGVQFPVPGCYLTVFWFLVPSAWLLVQVLVLVCNSWPLTPGFWPLAPWLGLFLSLRLMPRKYWALVTYGPVAPMTTSAFQDDKDNDWITSSLNTGHLLRLAILLSFGQTKPNMNIHCRFQSFLNQACRTVPSGFGSHHEPIGRSLFWSRAYTPTPEIQICIPLFSNLKIGLI